MFKIKRRGNLYLLLVPLYEALALPNQSKRATQKPTLICRVWRPRYGYTEWCPAESSRTICHTYITYPADIYHCFAFDWFIEFARFRRVKDKTSSKRLSLICQRIPTPTPFPYEKAQRGFSVAKVVNFIYNVQKLKIIFLSCLILRKLFPIFRRTFIVW